MINKKILTLSVLIFSGLLLAAGWEPRGDEKGVFIPASPQRTGDAAEGYKYLVTGDYVKGGLPYDYFLLASGRTKKNYLEREGLNAALSHDFTAVKAPNGENLVAPNCLQCHAQVFEGKLVMGMGNSFADFTLGQKLSPQAYAMLENLLKKGSASKYEASKSFIQVAKGIGPYLSTAVRGVNTADRLAAVLAAHRDPESFRWHDETMLDIPQQVIPSDVPAWWLLKKKHAMFYSGFGRGDFSKFLMASNLLTVNDTAESREVDSHFPNVLSYLYTLEAPKYPRPVNASLAKEGALVYTTNCSKCHGSYGSGASFPNLLIPESVIRTDSMLFKSNYQNPQFIKWFNSSWFSMGENAARLEPFNGYIAPPLDGVWCTAPYFHNGSVPTLAGVLNSKARPAYWQRNFADSTYDYEKLSWHYTAMDNPGATGTYNTSLPGYGNYGHNFGDKLTERQRKAVIEYLKTL